MNSSIGTTAACLHARNMSSTVRAWAAAGAAATTGAGGAGSSGFTGETACGNVATASGRRCGCGGEARTARTAALPGAAATSTHPAATLASAPCASVLPAIGERGTALLATGDWGSSTSVTPSTSFHSSSDISSLVSRRIGLLDRWPCGQRRKGEVGRRVRSGRHPSPVPVSARARPPPLRDPSSPTSAKAHRGLTGSVPCVARFPAGARAKRRRHSPLRWCVRPLVEWMGPHGCLRGRWQALPARAARTNARGRVRSRRSPWRWDARCRRRSGPQTCAGPIRRRRG